MYLPLTHLWKSMLVLSLYLVTLSFAALIVGVYCQEWRISGTRSGSAWDVQFNFKFFYLYNYKALRLNGVNALSLATTYSAPRTGSNTVGSSKSRLNTLSAALENGGRTELTTLLPYGMPKPLTDFIDGVNTKLSSRDGIAFDERLVFRPLLMADIFLISFGGVFMLLAALTLFAAVSIAAAIISPAFIKADQDKVDYRQTGWFKPLRTVPSSDVKNFDFTCATLPQDMPAWLRSLAGEKSLPEKGGDKKYASNNIILNLADGSRVAFYNVAKTEAKTRELAAALNKATGR